MSPRSAAREIAPLLRRGRFARPTVKDKWPVPRWTTDRRATFETTHVVDILVGKEAEGTALAKWASRDALTCRAPPASRKKTTARQRAPCRFVAPRFP